MSGNFLTFPVFHWNAFSIPVLLVGLILGLGVGVFVFLHDTRSLRNFSFFLVCGSTGLWLSTIVLVYVAPDPIFAAEWYKKVTFLGVSLISSSIFFFSTTLLPNRQSLTKWTLLMYSVGGICYLLGFSGNWLVLKAEQLPWGYYPKYGPVGHFYFWFFVVCYGIALNNIAKSIRLEENEIKKIQNKFFLIAFMVTFFGAIDFISKLTPFVVYPVGYVPIAVWIVLVAYAIIRYRALDIQTVIHKTIMWSTLSAVALFPLVLLVQFGGKWYEHSPWLFAAVMLPICAFFSFYLRWVHSKIDRFFNRRKVNLERVLDSFTADLVHLKNPKELIDKIFDTLQLVFQLEKLSLLLIDREKNQLQTVRREGWPVVDEKIFYGADHPFLAWIVKRDQIVDRRLLDMDPEYQSMPQGGKELIQKIQATYLVPLVLNQFLLGVIVLGSKRDHTSFNDVETRFINRFRAQTAIALSNSLLYGRVEEEVEKRTRELIDTKDQLTRAEKLATLGTLAGGVAHEINNPLTAILTNIQMMAMDVRSDEEKESLTLMEEATKRCRTIVQKLMAYARQNPEKRRNEPVDLAAVIKNTVGLLRYQFQQDNIQLLMKVDGVSKAIVLGNGSELEQVLTNLLLNARDAVKTVARQGEVLVSLAQNGAKLQLKVRDNGCGISAKVLPKIFDPFFTTKDVGKGTGLGLSICQSIIEQHHGKITVQSTVGEGTEFIVELPKPQKSFES